MCGARHTTTKLFVCLSILLSRAGALASNVGSRIVEHQISLWEGDKARATSTAQNRLSTQRSPGKLFGK